MFQMDKKETYYFKDYVQLQTDVKGGGAHQ